MKSNWKSAYLSAIHKTMNTHIFHGLIAGMVSAIAGVGYSVMYQSLMFLDFNEVLGYPSITGTSILSCGIMSIAYWSLEKLNKVKLKGIVNVVIVLFSFFSILIPVSISLPLDVDFPELFPGLVIPMHFFPALIFFGLTPFFNKPISNVQ